MLNHITLMGRIGTDIELRKTGSGVSVASFTMAVDRDFKSGGGEKETDWVDCVAWRQTGEFIDKYFAKGRMIVVSGRLQIRNWQDKEGNKRKTAEVVETMPTLVILSLLPTIMSVTSSLLPLRKLTISCRSDEADCIYYQGRTKREGQTQIYKNWSRLYA